MKQLLTLAGLVVLFGIATNAAAAQEKLNDRRHRDLIRSGGGPRPTSPRRLRARDQGPRRQDEWPGMSRSWWVDDELKPDAAVTKVKGLLERDKVDFVVGPIFSNILQAIHKPVTDSKTFLISPNAGPSSYAGKNCSPFFYVTSYQNDQVHEILGKVAQDRGYKRVYVLVPNYQAGQGFRCRFQTRLQGRDCRGDLYAAGVAGLPG